MSAPEVPVLFKDIISNDQLIESIEYMGFTEATPIQAEAIPNILQNKDLLACAQTGTGKTAAFVLPILQKIAEDKQKGEVVNSLIIVPTRELAIQIDRQITAIGYFLDISSIAVYGGGNAQEWEQQSRALKGNADIIIATPGRLKSFDQMSFLDLSHLKHFILDEADKMLDMGFQKDILNISEKLPKDIQTLLFSATMPTEIKKFSRKLLNNPYIIEFEISKPAEGVLMGAYICYANQKEKILKHILKSNKNTQRVIVFCSTKKAVNNIYNALKRAGLSVGVISSDIDQKQREETLKLFTNNTIQIIIATDVLSRGIDIKGVEMVINYDIPKDAEDYVHRVGRTARAKTKGIALTLVEEKDQYGLGKIEDLIGSIIAKSPIPEFLGPGPKYEPKKKRQSSFRKPFKKNNSKRPHSKYKSGGKNRRNNNSKNRPQRNNKPKSR